MISREQADIEIFRAAVQIYSGHLAAKPEEDSRSLRAICIGAAREMFAMQIIPYEEIKG